MSASMIWNGLLLLTLNGLGIAEAAAKPKPKATIPALSATYLQSTMVPKIRNLLQANGALNGQFLRLSFHDCAGAGGCDGCINLALAENAGLGNAVTALEGLLSSTDFSGKITRADLWALAATVVVNGAASRGQPQGAPLLLPYASFQTGRADCTSGQFRATNDVSSNFPAATLGSTGVTDYFSKNFGFDATQSVAIMGAHHIGGAHPDVSGFRGPWIAPGGVLDGSYYRNMANASMLWTQKVADNSVPQNLRKWQWVPNVAGGTAPPPPNAPAGTPGNIMMLDADMALFKNLPLSTDTNGKVTCTYGGANDCGAAATANQVVTYSQNKALFQGDFAKVFLIMQSVSGRPNNVPSFYNTLTTVTA